MVLFNLPVDLFEALLHILIEDSRKDPYHLRVSDELIEWLTDQIDAQIPD